MSQAKTAGILGATKSLVESSRSIGREDDEAAKNERLRKALTAEMAESTLPDGGVVVDGSVNNEAGNQHHQRREFFVDRANEEEEYGEHLHGQAGKGGTLGHLSIARRLRVAAKAATMTSALALSHRTALRGENCTYNLKTTSLFLLGPDNTFRRNMFLVVDNRWFERAVLFIIFVNCITLILATPVIVDQPGVQTLVDVSEYIFQVLFTIEMLMKIIALGFVGHQHSYLRSGWNQMDFLIVVLGYVAMGIDGSNFSAIRLVRVLRPLKAVSKVPELAALVSALMASLPPMRDVMTLMFFLLLIFAILGLQAFVGKMHYRCYSHTNVTQYFNASSEQPISNLSLLPTTPHFSNWSVKIALDEGDTDLCDPDGLGHNCLGDAKCERHLDMYKRDYLNYDNLATSMLLVFKLVSMDNWPENLRQLQQVSGFWTFLFPLVIVIFGSFFCINLILAILSAEYQDASEKKGMAEDVDPDDEAADLLADAQDDAEFEDVEEDLDGTSPPEENLQHSFSVPQHVIDNERKNKQQQQQQPDDKQLTTVNSLVVPNAGKKYNHHGNNPTTADSGPLSSNGSVTIGSDSEGPFGEGAVVMRQSDTNSGMDTSMDLRSTDSNAPSSVRRNSKLRRRRTKQVSWKTKARIAILTIITSNIFNNFMMCVTVINVLALAVDHHGIDDTLNEALNWINFACSLIFIIEFGIKFAGLHFTYFHDGFNRFDFVLVLISIPEMALAGSAGSGSAFSALRAFRLARIFRIVKASKTIKKLIFTVFQAAASTSYLFMLLCLFILIFALVGINFMKNAYPQGVRPNFNDLGEALLSVFVIITGENWMDTSEVGMKGSHWSSVFYFLILYCIGNYIILNLFVAILIGSFANAADNLNAEEAEEEGKDPDGETMVVAVTHPDGETVIEASNREQGDDQAAVNVAPENGSTPTGEEEEQNGNRTLHLAQFSAQQSREVSMDDSKRNSTSLPASPSHRNSVVNTGHAEEDVMALSLRQSPKRNKSLGDVFGNIFKANAKSKQKKLKQLQQQQRRNDTSMSGVDEAELDDISDILTGKSFMVFTSTNPLRRACANLVIHPYFEILIIVLIAFSCIMLGFDNPASRENSSIRTMLEVTNILLAVLFCLECLLQCIAWGVWRGEGSYLSNPWNRLDFIVVLASIVGFFIPVAQMLRSLRVFRLAARSESLRVVIIAMFKAIPAIANVCVLLLFGFIVFGILGVQLFKGAMVKCNDESISLRSECNGYFHQTTTTRTYINGTYYTSETTQFVKREWEHAFFNFNNLGNALLTLFVLAMNDGWSDILFQATDSVSYDEAMRLNARPYMGLFVVIFVVFGSFFMVNLFIGSLIDSFSRERDKKEGRIDDKGTALLTAAQSQWLRAWRVARTSRLDPRIPKPSNPIRKLCCYIFFSDEARLHQSQRFEVFITCLIILNVFFMCLQHFDQPQEITDTIYYTNLIFAIAYTLEAAIKIIALQPYSYFVDGWNRFDFILVPIAYIALFVAGGGAGAVRTLRVLRVLRLIKRAEGLQRLFNSLLFAIPQLMNTTLLLLLTVFIFGVIGTDLFGEVVRKPEYPDSAFDEFFNFDNAGYSMVLLTQIATTEGWWDSMISGNVNPGNSPCRHELNNCGTWASIPFFILFMLFANCVCINLFIFVIVDNYLEVQQLMDDKSQRIFKALDTFKMEWSLIDRDATQSMRWESLILILRKLPGDFGFKEKKDTPELALMKKLRFMDIPVDSDGGVRYKDCVHGLTKELFGVTDEEGRMKTSAFLNDEELQDHEKCFKVHHAFAVRKILKRFRANQKEKKLQLLVKDKLMGMVRRRREAKSKNDEVGAESPNAKPAPAGGSLLRPPQQSSNSSNVDLQHPSPRDTSQSPEGGAAGAGGDAKSINSGRDSASEGFSLYHQDSLPGHITDDGV